ERLHGPVVFSNVNFRYGSKKLVLKDISFCVEQASAIGVVGSSGSGKSSLIKLLLKFYEPETGAITIDGRDLRDIDTTWLRQRIGYVSQDVFLFHGSVRDNIALGKPEASFDEIVAASHKAQADQFISELPNRSGGLTRLEELESKLRTVSPPPLRSCGPGMV
ncbi:MAG: ATP-binding cassette domain-containing protein, partial [Spirochaetota bacterium]